MINAAETQPPKAQCNKINAAETIPPHMGGSKTITLLSGETVADSFVIIIKERTEGGLNKRAYFVPPYSAHFWFFRIEQSRVRYGDSIFHIFICQLAMQSIYWLESLNHS